MSKNIKIDRNVLEINGDPFNFTSEYWEVSYNSSYDIESITFYSDSSKTKTVGVKNYTYVLGELTEIELVVNGNTYTKNYTYTDNDITSSDVIKS